MSLPILCYHKVGDEATEGRWLNIHPDRLRQHIRFFKRRGRSFVTAGELAGALPTNAVCLTFDDAYCSMMQNGLTVLRGERVTASIYIVAGKVGTESHWDGERAAKLSDWPEILAAASEGFEIGNHTHSHADLSLLTQDQQLAEFTECQSALEGHGVRAASTAFPFGKFNDQTRGAAERAGIQVGLALGKRIATESDDRLRLPRIILSYGDTIPMLMYKLWVRPKL